MDKDSVRLFIATASGNSWYHREYMTGCMDASHVFNGTNSGPAYAMQSIAQSIYVEKNRDILTELFLRSDGTHLLFVDTDVGFRAAHIAELLSTGLDVVSGLYIKKQDEVKVVGVFIEQGVTKIKECHVVPGGFLLLKREAVERVAGCNPDKYQVHEDGMMAHCLWQPRWKTIKGIRMLERDDVAFSGRCREAGLKLWMHLGVILPHFGEKAYSLVGNG